MAPSSSPWWPLASGGARPQVPLRNASGLAARALISIAVAQAVLEHGAFSTNARVAFVGLAGMAAAAGLLAGGQEAVRVALHPLVGVLLGLSALGALSSLWTVGLPEDALAWALLPAGYALLAAAVMAAAVGEPVRVRNTVLATLCGCAFASGVVGLIGAATFSEPQAFWLNGVWRPAGTLEYAPALVLLEVCALAALLGALSSGARLAWLAAAPVAAAGAVLGLSNSRLGLAMALVVLAGGVVAAQPARRGRALRGVALVVLAALAARVGLGGIGPAGAGSETWRVAVVIGICVQAPLAWWVMGAAARRSQRVGRVGAVGLVAAVGLSIALAIALAPSGAGRSARPEHPQAVRSVHRDVLHGRGQIWAAGVRAFVRRPLQGHGAGSFLAATADLQRPVITSYAHDLPLELGVELGVAGALLGLALYVLTARAWWRARGVAGAPLLAVPALAFLAANLVDWPWHVGGIGAIWAAATGALIAAGTGDRSRRSDTVAPVHGPPGRQRKVQMTSVRKVVSTLLISGACVTGLAACGGSDTVSDSSFLDRCKKTIDTNAALKAYSADTCNCVQKKLEAQGFGKKSPDDKAISPQTAAATRDCLKQVAG